MIHKLRETCAIGAYVVASLFSSAGDRLVASETPELVDTRRPCPTCGDTLWTGQIHEHGMVAVVASDYGTMVLPKLP